jgi:single-stranded-DNA-specific exonuclease
MVPKLETTVSIMDPTGLHFVREEGSVRVPKQWKLLPHDRPAIERLSKELGISPVLAQLLLNRGVTQADTARRFLSAPLSGLHEPELLPGVSEAAERLHRAARDGKRIVIYGDYDVDGITGTTVLWRCLRLAGAQNVDFYVPHRLEEGYGLNSEALKTLKQQGAEVVVTVDCGITAIEEAQAARDLGLELIITDHHTFKEQLPEAAVLVHPRLPGSAYPFVDLCGAGVAFKLAWAICQRFSNARKVSDAFRQFLMESVSLVALGTVADVVPLLDENRIFVRHGLKSLKESPSVGLKALLEAAVLHEKPELESGHIGFALAPRLNAAGRLGQARLAVELLAADSPQRAADLARYLNDQNNVRQSIERKIVTEARELIESPGFDLEQCSALVLANAEWHAGVIGIVAGRLADRYARPALLISLKEDIGQGSARSVDGFHLYEALAACREHLVGYGGHAAAAGFKIRADRVDAFREQFCGIARGRLCDKPRQHTLMIDAEVPLSALTVGLVKGIKSMEPHGMGNRRPLFLAGGLQVVGMPKKVGGGERHLSFRVSQEGGAPVKAIAFGFAERETEMMSCGGACSLVFTPALNEWQGRVTVDLEVIDLHPGPVAPLC